MRLASSRPCLASIHSDWLEPAGIHPPFAIRAWLYHGRPGGLFRRPAPGRDPAEPVPPASKPRSLTSFFPS